MKFFRPRRCSFSEDTACLAVYSEPCHGKPVTACARVFSLPPQKQPEHPAGMLASSAVWLQSDGCLPSGTGRDLDCARLKAEEERVSGSRLGNASVGLAGGALLPEVELVEFSSWDLQCRPTSRAPRQQAGGPAQ